MEEKPKKPKFRRKDWHKKIKLGSQNKSKVKWRAAKGRHNKIRLGRKGHSSRPKIGWSIGKKSNGSKIPLIQNVKQLENLKSGDSILIASIGKKKRQEIIKIANEKKLTITNKYPLEKKQNATI